MGKGDRGSRKSQSRRRKEQKRKGGSGINLFAAVRQASWKKPPVERLYERNQITDLQLWAARGIRAGYEAATIPMRAKSPSWVRIDRGPAGVADAAAAEAATVADHYVRCCRAMDADDRESGRPAILTREVVHLVCIVDTPLYLVEDSLHLPRGSVRAHLVRGLDLYVEMVGHPERERLAEPENPPAAYSLTWARGTSQ